jgi:hypothetical protein
MERLRDNPQLTFEATRQAAEQVGIVIQPIQYGRARRQLGLISAQPPPPKRRSRPNNLFERYPLPSQRTPKPARQNPTSQRVSRVSSSSSRPYGLTQRSAIKTFERKQKSAA